MLRPLIYHPQTSFRRNSFWDLGNLDQHSHKLDRVDGGDEDSRGTVYM